MPINLASNDIGLELTDPDAAPDATHGAAASGSIRPVRQSTLGANGHGKAHGQLPGRARSQGRQRLRAGVIVSLMLIALVAIAAVAVLALSYFEDRAVEAGNAQAELYARVLERSIDRYRYLPSILAQDDAVATAALAAGHSPAVSRRLEAFSEVSGLEAIYIMNAVGDVLATSNHAATVSFLGQNYGFRPYFVDAMAGEVGEYFAVGATTGRPGYFIAAHIGSGSAEAGAKAGVVAVKLDVAELQAGLVSSEAPVLVSNSDDIIVLSSEPSLLYSRLTDVPNGDGVSSRQFGRSEIPSANWSMITPNEVQLGAETFVLGTAQVGLPDWRVSYLLPKRQVVNSALGATASVGAAILLVLLMATFLRSRRIEAALAQSRESRRRLAAANEDLERAQFRLRQRDKLVTLGQLSASISHELSQPISAMRNHLAAAEIGGEVGSARTLKRLTRLVERLAGLTRQLRFFATPDDGQVGRVPAASVISNAVELVVHDAEREGVRIEIDPGPAGLEIVCTPLRMEQAVINLLRNALRALLDVDEIELRSQKLIQVQVASIDNREVRLTVRDNGPGIRGVENERLTEPFVTTRASGEGMGLGLAIVEAIAHEQGGRLEASSSQAGAEFSLILPAPSQLEQEG
ncbi:MAG: ATP-binding protein [Pseudomonadota bacterium]